MRVLVVLFITILGSFEVHSMDYSIAFAIQAERVEVYKKIGIFAGPSQHRIDERVANSVIASRSLFDDVKTGLQSTGITTKTTETFSKIVEDMKSVKEAFEKVKTLAPKLVKFGVKFIPLAGAVVDIGVGLMDLFKEEDASWKDEFDKKLQENFEKSQEETDRKFFLRDIQEVKDTLDNINKKIPWISESLVCIKSKHEDLRPTEDQERIPSQYLDEYQHLCNVSGTDNAVSIMHDDLEKIAGKFLKRDTHYRHFPLIAAPILIQLSSLVLVFEPIALEFITGWANKYKLSCLYRDALIGLLPFALEARFAKTNVNIEIQAVVRNVDNKLYSFRHYWDQISYYCPHNCESGDETCLTDDFSANVLYCDSLYAIGIKYIEFLRLSVEDKFNIDMLHKACGQPMATPKDTGYATIKLKRFTGKELLPGQKSTNKCDDETKCDPYVELYIDGKSFTSKIKDDTEDYVVNESYYTPEPIEKSATVHIVVRDSDANKSDPTDSKMLDTSTTIGQLMEHPRVCMSNNCIDVDIIWEPERDETTLNYIGK